MKKFIWIALFCPCMMNMQAQEVGARVAEVNYTSIAQDGINLSGTFGESIVGLDVMDEIIIVHGYYSGLLADTTTTVHQAEQIHGLFVFPNPARDGIILSSEIPPSSNFKVGLLTETGILLKDWTWPFESPRFSMDLRPFPPGKYLIRVDERNTGKSSTLMIVKQ